MKRGASAEWTGDLKGGKGTIDLDSGALKKAAYSFTTRFEEGVTGTNRCLEGLFERARPRA